MLLVDDLAAGGTKNLRHTPRGLVTLVKALIKTSNCENSVIYFSEKFQKIAAIAMLFWFSVTKQSPENGFGFLH